MTDKKQQIAINHGFGPLMIIAGPGSGKTYTTVERVAHLITNLGVIPSTILVVTFSKAAAAEMKNRFIKRGVHDGSLVTFGTFHSVFFSILKYAYGWKAEDYILEEDPYTGIVNEIKYDEMLNLTLELLRKRKDVLAVFKDKYKWILVDEFQDISDVQYEIIKLLSGPDGNITVVGDDDQSIYGFRGASPGIMLRFQNFYKKAEIIQLETNYRSTPQIVSASQNLISHNRKRFKKHYHSANPDGPEITVKAMHTIRDELDYTANDIKKHIDAGMSVNDTAILTRTNRQEKYVRDVMSEYDIHAVTMTFHKSKGLEYDTVYIVGASEGITPNKIQRKKDEIEEERRLFYVAVTRAKRELYIFHVSRRKEINCRPSRFIAELMKGRTCGLYGKQ